MENLSSELLSIILEKINNPLELLRLRETCKNWSAVIDNIFERLKLWQLFCLSNNNTKLWAFEIFEKRSPRAIKKEFKKWRQMTWKKIYLSYKKWQIRLKFPYICTFFNFVQIFTDDERITCIDVWANYLAVGSTTGKVYFFTTKNCIKQISTRSYTNCWITRIKFWYTDTKNLIAVVSLGNQNLEFWDVENQQRFINPHGNQPSVTIESKGHRLFIANDNEIIEYKWSENELSRGREIEFEPSTNRDTGQSLKIIGISSDQTKLTVVRSEFDFIMVASLKIPTSESPSFTMLPEESSLHRMEPIRNNEFICYIPMNNVIFIINDLYFYVSIKDSPGEKHRWKTYSLPDLLKKNISSVLFYSNILFFGLKSGSILIYFLNDIQYLLNINLRETFLKTLELDTEPITNLSVTEFNGTMRIFATTGSKLYIVQFFDNISIQQNI